MVAEIVKIDTATTLSLAEDLARLVKEKKLSIQIQGKDYMQLEGWQYAGLAMGIVPIANDPIKIETKVPGETKYSCSVNLIRVATGEIIGHGFGLCSSLEPTKRSFQEYAIASMAQTRAIAKAFRNSLAFLSKVAGFEATPAEEMSDAELIK